MGSAEPTARSEATENMVYSATDNAKIIKKTADGKIPLEVALMQQVADVPGVIKILDWFESTESFFIVMEKFVGQDLFDYISERGPLKEPAARDLFAQVLET